MSFKVNSKQGRIVTIVAIAVLAITVAAAFVMTFWGFARVADAMPLDNDQYDAVFIKALDDTLDYEGSAQARVSANKEYVFDVNLDLLGFVYNFAVDGKQGFAIVVNVSGSPELTEICPEAQSPYAYNDNVLNVYLAMMQYAYFADGKYCFAGTEVEIPSEMLENAVFKSYGLGSFTYTYETIYYTHRSENKKELCYRHPACTEMANYTNACGPIAAGSIIQYYDRYYTDLIPNFDPGMQEGSLYAYKMDNSTLETIKEELYVDMHTNQDGSGTTIAWFLNGLTTFVNKRDYRLVFRVCVKSDGFRFDLVKDSLDNGMPVAIFVDHFTAASLLNQTNVEYLEYLNSTGAHIMAGFGYNEITYTLTDGTTRKDSYIAVATGASSMKRGYYNINYNTTIDQCYAFGLEKF